MTKTIIEDHLKGQITLRSKGNRTDVIVELPYFLRKVKNEEGR